MKNKPAYHEFRLVEETNLNGWIYGAITLIEKGGCDNGDGFIQSPSKRRAGLVWDVGTGRIETISPPDRKRWGVYQIYFPKKIYSIDDLIDNFKTVLPDLQRIYYEIYPNENTQL